MFKIFIIFIIILLNSCSPLSVSTTAIPMKKGEERTTLSGGVMVLNEENNNKSSDELFMPYIYGSIAYKFDKVGVEFTLNGVKIIEDLYLGNNLYIASFQTAYLVLIGIGGNAGLMFSYLTNIVNFYISGKFEGYTIKSDGMQNVDYTHSYFIPSVGILLGNDDTKIFLECIFLKTLVDTQKEPDRDTLIFLLGISF